MSILDKIIQFKKQEVRERKELYPVKLLERSIHITAPTVSLKKYLLREDKSGIIAEFKRKSPSKGYINKYANVEEVSIAYMQAGASALSVLTDNEFFGGDNNDLEIARKFNYCPILRKEFVIDEYQVIEARSKGADAILLIAEVLSIEEVKQLSRFAKSLGLEVLFEIHSQQELSMLCEDVDIVGVNNRNLKSFEVDINTSVLLSDKIPNEFIKISESGLNNPDSVNVLKQAGYKGFLIGEHFMRTANPGKTCEKFIKDLREIEKYETVLC